MLTSFRCLVSYTRIGNKVESNLNLILSYHNKPYINGNYLFSFQMMQNLNFKKFTLMTFIFCAPGSHMFKPILPVIMCVFLFVCLWFVIMILCYNCGRKMQSHIMDLANVFYPSMYYIIVCFSHCEASLSLGKALYQLSLLLLFCFVRLMESLLQFRLLQTDEVRMCFIILI